jgi:hypothetical protein
MNDHILEMPEGKGGGHHSDLCNIVRQGGAYELEAGFQPVGGSPRCPSRARAEAVVEGGTVHPHIEGQRGEGGAPPRQTGGEGGREGGVG